jgi:hypothetical protein
MFFCTIKQTMVTVQNHTNGSTKTYNPLSDMAKKSSPTLIVLTLDKRKCKRQELIFRSHANGNHQCIFVLPYQESDINTDYRSTMCKLGHTLWEALEYVLQHRIISTFFVWQPLTTTVDDTSGAWVEV